MPSKPPSVCRYVGCHALILQAGLCDKHKLITFKQQKQNSSADYQARNRFYQRKNWKQLRHQKLILNPLCELCELNGKRVIATIVDHIEPISIGGRDLDLKNIQSLCNSCHSAKTIRETLNLTKNVQQKPPRGG